MGWIVGALLSAGILGAAFGPPFFAVGLACGLAATAWVVLWLPRAAHAAFEASRYDRALRRYRWIGALAFTRHRARAALLSRAACHLAAGRAADAAPLLATIDAGELDASERVVWLNNRACTLLDTGDDAPAALALVEEATALRPDVPAIQHTRGRALLAVGRLDDAIGVLDAMRLAGELPPRLEAERCRDLAVAWERKGQAEYAADYRDRARLVAS